MCIRDSYEVLLSLLSTCIPILDAQTFFLNIAIISDSVPLLISLTFWLIGASLETFYLFHEVSLALLSWPNEVIGVRLRDLNID